MELVYDSRKAGPDCVFVCLTGAVTDGHRYIGQAYDAGCRHFVVEREIDRTAYADATFELVPDTRQELAVRSAAQFGHPAGDMTLIGITGTKGKTTTSYMLRSIFETAGRPCGLIGTTGIFYRDVCLESKNTTPESYELQKILRQMANSGVKTVVMEVSSQGLKQRRTDGLVFDAAVFLNLSEDHIGPDEHASFAEYRDCKAKLFSQCKLAFANADDPYAPQVVFCPDVTFGEDGHYNFNEWPVRPRMPGQFNRYNALAAACVADKLGVDRESILTGIQTAVVRGRMEPVDVPAPFDVLIDYAHNALSMESLMTAVKEKYQRIICVFGAGGNRAKARRVDMGAAAGKSCALSVLTSDNPRDEEVSDIIQDILEGLKPTGGPYVIQPDRTQAIHYALRQAGPGDVVLIVGKGHQLYEEIKGVKYPFDDREAVKSLFQ